MAIRSAEYENLVARGILNAAAKNADSIDQYVKTASDLLADARRPSNSPHGRTLMANEGLFGHGRSGIPRHQVRGMVTDIASVRCNGLRRIWALLQGR